MDKLALRQANFKNEILKFKNANEKGQDLTEVLGAYIDHVCRKRILEFKGKNIWQGNLSELRSF
jgi:hypothetical protein